ncbi:MAG: hypothetical protein UV73_C0004G0032 [Candidatus Gottesmanbacteria bacterium GW2011_GWA2_43_14]|uniref:Uncharacterized protein n=1 Tax=Candidatus Gottesmanbacteria bacterium GW2011_GWA2_43_14 TaxID=1618443 RepID=A0A0G1DJ41_9BACT|nr:MAG: hypothetical protein UV73_C0004G0032 [Candidatus Gottesmanbacteria bacterium GW2011_GWA2_43_14]
MILIFLFISILLFQSPPSVYAAPSNCLGGGEGLGPFAKFLCGGVGVTTDAVGNRLNSVISAILGLLTVIAGLWFLIQFILAGFNWINAGGDKNNAQAAWQKMTNAVVGLIIVVFAWVFVALIGKLLNINILDPGDMLKNLKITG